MIDDHYEVGFGRPPKASRYRKGQSGNPRGRPRRRPNFKEDFNAELREPLVLQENGRERRLTKQRALIKSLMSLAIKGNVRAMNAVLAATRSFDLGQDERSAEAVEPVDLDILEAFVARERRRKPSESAKATSRKGDRASRKGGPRKA